MARDPQAATAESKEVEADNLREEQALEAVAVVSEELGSRVADRWAVEVTVAAWAGVAATPLQEWVEAEAVAPWVEQAAERRETASWEAAMEAAAGSRQSARVAVVEAALQAILGEKVAAGPAAVGRGGGASGKMDASAGKSTGAGVGRMILVEEE